MTFATKLTLLRILAIPFFLVAFYWQPLDVSLANDWGKVAATIIFILASITDYIDGYYARLYKQVTTLGRFMDPIADKLLVSTALICMVEYREITYTAGYIAIIIIAREFAVTGLRLVCAEKGRVIDASSAGKVKTTFQLTAIITTLCLTSLRVIFETYSCVEYNNILMGFCSPLIQSLMGLAAVATLYSGYDYFKQNWRLLDQ